MENQTTVTEFILRNLSSDPQMQIFLFSMFLLIYIITLGSNIVIMVVIRADSHLHTPMYFFLFHLSFLDICYSSVTVPNMLMNFLVEHKTISFNGCIVQIFFISLSIAAEIFILTAMAYDRYTAICDPLRYMERMSKQICVQLVSGAWTIGFFHALLNTVFTSKLRFCGPNEINHFSCELPPLLQRSCTDTLTNQTVLIAFGVCVALCCFAFITVSYIHIFSAVLKIPSVEGRHKAFSTCLPYLTVVMLFLGTGIFSYMMPTSASAFKQYLVAVFYSVVPPLINSIIYRRFSLRGKQWTPLSEDILFWQRGLVARILVWESAN
uniref:Olfactory receptor n=1 Tax=Gopherus evgoodei TaxID=1825980 RepID=A0A8C4Y9D2_9SAUR